MSIFSSILAKIFPSNHPSVNAAPAAPATPTVAANAPPAVTPVPSSTPAAVPPPNTPLVDVAAVLDNRLASQGQQLHWRTSIVDLMKLLDLDSSLANRKALAAELHYTGDSNDSAAMNVWLHKQVMRGLAKNGGKVPDEFKD